MSESRPSIQGDSGFYVKNYACYAAATRSEVPTLLTFIQPTFALAEPGVCAKSKTEFCIDLGNSILSDPDQGSGLILFAPGLGWDFGIVSRVRVKLSSSVFNTSALT